MHPRARHLLALVSIFLLHPGHAGADQYTPPPLVRTPARDAEAAAAAPPLTPMTPAIEPRDRLRASGLTIAGGVSLGSYGAGFLYYYTLARQQAGQTRSLRVVTGASAGSINAVLAALSMCQVQRLDPESNLFFDTWIPVGMHGRDGFPGLHDASKVTPRSLFSREPIDRTAEMLERVFESEALDGWNEAPCDVLLGIVSTQLVPNRIPLQRVAPTPVVARQTQKFLVRMSRQAGQRPVLHAETSSSAPQLYDLFPILGRSTPSQLAQERTPEHDVSFADLARLMKASASFPLAFEPMRVPITTYDQLTGRWSNMCDPGDSSRCLDPEFIDGGVFENVPLRLARRLEAAPRANVVVDTESTPWKRPERAHRSKQDLLTFLTDLGGSILSSTMAAELFSTFEQDPDLREPNSEVAFTTRNLPTASGHFMNFLGFFDRDFRVFDFYLGMLDARAFVSPSQRVTVPAAHEHHWQLMRCFEAWYDAAPDFRSFPKASELSACTRLNVGTWDEVKKVWTGADYTKMSAQQKSTFNAVRLLASAHHYRHREVRQPNAGTTAELHAWFDLMKDQGIHLSEIDEHEFDNSPELVRNELVDLLDKFARMQEGWLVRKALVLGVRTAANTLDYREPHYALTLGVHADRGLEAGGSISGPRARIELNLRAQAIRLQAGALRGATVRAGPRLAWSAGRKAFGALVQLEPFLGCGASAYLRDDGRELALSPELGLYLAVLQSLYFSLSGGPHYRLWRDAKYELNHPSADALSWHMFGSVGWRFLKGTARAPGR